MILVQRTQFTCVVTVVIILMFGISSAAAFFNIITADVRSIIEQKLLNREVKVVPQVNKINVGFGRVDSGEFYFIKSYSKIFHWDQNVDAQVFNISFRADSVVFYLRNEEFGTGQIKIQFSEAKAESRHISSEDIEEALLLALSNEDSQKVLVNTETKTFHLHTSNHSPGKHISVTMTIDDAVKSGYKSCGYCFVRPLYLPDSEIEAQLARQGAASIRYNKPLVIDEKVQKKVNDFGNAVLSKWPTPLLGYQYKFQVIDDIMPNALALAGGHIMVTSGLLNSIESDIELEAVLAHEIAHVERRHVLKSYYRAVQEMIARGMAQAMGGVASARGGQSSATTAVGITMATMLAIDVYTSGYPQELEREADDLASLYFEHNGKDKKYLEQVFRKLEFQNLVFRHDPDPMSDTHPYLSERIERVNNGTYEVFENISFVYKAASNPAVRLDFLYQVKHKEDSSFSLYIDDYAFIERLNRNNSIGKDLNLYIQISDKNGSHRYSIIGNELVRDMWGAYLTFQGKKGRLLDGVKQVDIIVEKEGSDAWDTDSFRFQ